MSKLSGGFGDYAAGGRQIFICFTFFCGAMFFGYIMAQLSEILAVKTRARMRFPAGNCVISYKLEFAETKPSCNCKEQMSGMWTGCHLKSIS